MQPKISNLVKFSLIECWNRQQWQELDRNSPATGLCQSEDIKPGWFNLICLILPEMDYGPSFNPFSCQKYIGINMLNGYDHI